MWKHESHLIAYAGWCTVAVFWALVSGCDLRSSPSSQPGVGEPTFSISIEPIADDVARVEVRAFSSAAGWLALESSGFRLSDALSFSVVEGSDESPESTVPLLGSYQADAHSLRFRPALPLLPGQSYCAQLTMASPAGVVRMSKNYTVPAPPAAAPPRVIEIHPSASVLPANHLKFYVLFSESMRQGTIFQYFRLRNVTRGEDVPRPFRHTELWDGNRLTLWFHPGRQKTGVNLNVELGSILRAGDEYELVISSAWLSLKGQPLGVDVTKQFRAGPPDSEKPAPTKWAVELPRAGTSDPIIYRFSKPLDWALLQSEVTVLDSANRPLAGGIKLREDDTVWTFRPRSPWQSGHYRLAVGSVLEDLAGNSVARPFEVDVNAPRSAKVEDTVYVDFQIKGGEGEPPGKPRTTQR